MVKNVSLVFLCRVSRDGRQQWWPLWIKHSYGRSHCWCMSTKEWLSYSRKYVTKLSRSKLPNQSVGYVSAVKKASIWRNLWSWWCYCKLKSVYSGSRLEIEPQLPPAAVLLLLIICNHFFKKEKEKKRLLMSKFLLLNVILSCGLESLFTSSFINVTLTSFQNLILWWNKVSQIGHNLY